MMAWMNEEPNHSKLRDIQLLLRSLLHSVRSQTVKKAYLLAGSLGLLGLVGAIPATASQTSTIQSSNQTAATLLGSTTTEQATSASVLEPAQAAPTTTATTPAAKPLLVQPSAQPVAKDNSLAQVTSVSELSDVQPTDWAFQAVQSLVERYGCIEGYPDKTFRGNRAATRYELAAALNACLNQISERFVTAEDLATLRQLQDEFAAELATLRGRVDALEARTSELEANQFSTTTKLQGEVVIAPQFGEVGEDPILRPLIGNPAFQGNEVIPGDTGRPTMIGRARLNFNTSFSGSDLLQTQLEAGNEGQDLFGNLLLSNYAPGGGFSGTEPFYVDFGAVDYGFVSNEFNLRRLAYTFKAAENIAITFGPRLFPSDFVDFNSYANNSAQDFSSGFFINNPLIIQNGVDALGGAGAALDWNFGGGPVTLRAVYVAGDGDSAVPGTGASGFGPAFGGGLAGDPYQGTVELELAASENFAIRAQYTNATTFNLQTNAYGVNAEATLGRFGIFGRYAYADVDSFGVFPAGNFNAQTWMAGVGIRDLILPGSLLAFAAGQPFINSIGEAPGLNDATQTNYEAFYRFAVNDNITITPTVMAITDANNSSANDTVFQGLLRTTFSF